MKAAAPLDGRLSDYLAARIRDGDDGKTLLVGFQSADPVFALAAGLRGEQDHPVFRTFARYLIHHRFDCDGHALMLPAIVGDKAVYIVEVMLTGSQLSAWMVQPDGDLSPWPVDGGLIGDLNLPPPTLPGIQRREMDRLYDQSKVPLP